MAAPSTYKLLLQAQQAIRQLQRDLYTSKGFTKGRMAVVEGRLQVRDWKDKDGAKRRSTEVIADNVYFGDSKRSKSGTPEAQAGEIRELPDEEKGDLPF